LEEGEGGRGRASLFYQGSYEGVDIREERGRGGRGVV